MKLPRHLLSKLAALAILVPSCGFAQPGGAPTSLPFGFSPHKPTGTAPAITTQPASKSVTTGASVAFTVVATGTPTPTYQWYLNGRSIRGANAATYTISSAAPSNAGGYTVSVSNDVGRVTSSEVTLSVANSGVVTVEPKSQTINTGTALWP